ncbi:transglycosylase SLT domain-containing protein [Oecophyllibacter saccharovorans]|uniref:transglycosylase SLT domain-containing protein n=1 Tax=Oecophyllibacter saccharovorans TaxID=2558360 RepID=UPI001F4FE90F|nr:hypothetical protein [Oecophyllibacter saccharovorans]
MWRPGFPCFQRPVCSVGPAKWRRAGIGLAGLCLLQLAGCASPPPQHPGNLCDIFREKRGWYFSAMKEEAHWHVPSAVPMAMMYQESGYHSSLHTKRTYILWIIPWGYQTTAYGYPQAKDEVWDEFNQATGRDGSRENFGDSLDFMDWYIAGNQKNLGIPVTNAAQQYLAYHEGRGGYSRRSYSSKGWLVQVAGKVGARARAYQRQYDSCKESLKPGFWERFWNAIF